MIILSDYLYVEELLKSIIHQSYGYNNIELIVLDDYSTDGSCQVVQKLADIYGFKFIANPINKGICANINKSLPLVNGKYLCLTGSDDVWLPNKLIDQVTYMEMNEKAAVCSGNVTRIDKEGNKLPAAKQRSGTARVYTFEAVFLRDFIFSTTCAMIRKSVLDKVGNYDETLKIEDYYMWLKIASAGYELHFIEETLGHYRIHDSNSIHKSLLIYQEMMKILATYATHPLYKRAVRRLKVVYFPQIAQANKKKALGLLPAAISNTKFFYRGMYHLLKPLKLQFSTAQ